METRAQEELELKMQKKNEKEEVIRAARGEKVHIVQRVIRRKRADER